MSLELEKLLALEDKMDKLESLLIIGMKENLTPDEAAIYMSVGVGHVYKLTSGTNPEIGFSKPNGKLKYIKKSDLDVYMSMNRRYGKMEVEELAQTVLKQRS
jgi:excisionase family DNA binding protein